MAALPEVDDAVGFRFGSVRPVTTVGDDEERVVGMNGTGLEDVVDLQMQAGSVADIGDDGMLVFADEAQLYGLSLGDRMPLRFPERQIDVRVAGIYGQDDLFFGSPFVISSTLFRQGFAEADLDYRAYATAASGVPVDTARTAAAAELRDDFPNIEVLTREQYRGEQEQAIDEFLAVTVALLFLSEIIAILGIVNTLALSVFERTHEIGMLRAVGMTRRQLRRVVRGESVIIAVIGGVVGLAIGLLVGLGVHDRAGVGGHHRVHDPARARGRVRRDLGARGRARRGAPRVAGVAPRRARRHRRRLTHPRTGVSSTRAYCVRVTPVVCPGAPVRSRR